jgi:hypothetical protein
VDLSNPNTVIERSTCGHPGSGENVVLYSHYAILAASYGGLAVIDVANPDSVFPVSNYVIHNVYGVAVNGNIAFAACDSGLYSMDVSNPAALTIVGLCRGIGRARNVAIRDNLAFVVGDGLHIIDIANPAAPVCIGSCALPASGIDVALAGDFAYVAAGDSGLRVIDFMNLTTPVEIGHYNAHGSAYGVAAVGNRIYLADGEYFGLYERLSEHFYTVTSPNGGEQWNSQAAYNITWTSVGVQDSVHILLNRNYPTGIWQPLFTAAANSGSAVWTAAGPHSHHCRIKIENADDPDAADISNANFMISCGLLHLNPRELDYGGVPVDSTAISQFWIRNTGADTLQIDSVISSSAAFADINDWQHSVIPGDSIVVVIAFAPRAVRYYSGFITIYSSAGDSVVMCAGSGLAPSSMAAHNDLPIQYRLYPAYPNPFNAQTTLAFDLPLPGIVSLRIFDMLGRTVAVLQDGFVEAGSHRVIFDGTALASGLYFARLQAGAFVQSTKLVLMK